MIGYVTLGTNDLPRAAAFYDALLAEIGAKRVMELGRGYGWGTGPKSPMFAILTPFDKQPATVGNGVMISFAVDSKDKVNAVHKKALELGSKDEGPVGARSEHFYAGYFRDLEGNKLCVFCMS